MCVSVADILGDGTVHPAEFMKGPLWLRGFRGNELQRLARQVAYEGPYLRTVRPAEHHNINKQIFYLYKRYNQRRSRSNYWSGRQGRTVSRLFSVSKW